jgi:hypothetical protein
MAGTRACASGSTAPSRRCRTRAMFARAAGARVSNGARSARTAAALTRWLGGPPPQPPASRHCRFWPRLRARRRKNCRSATQQMIEPYGALSFKPVPSRFADVLVKNRKLLGSLHVRSFAGTISLVSRCFQHFDVRGAGQGIRPDIAQRSLQMLWRRSLPLPQNWGQVVEQRLTGESAWRRQDYALKVRLPLRARLSLAGRVAPIAQR